jgi:hypothetical protein
MIRGSQLFEDLQEGDFAEGNHSAKGLGTATRHRNGPVGPECSVRRTDL